MMSPAVQSQLEAVIGAPPPASVPCDAYAILDGAVVRQLPDYLDERDSPFACLLRGETDPLVLTRAPYLVRIAPGDEILSWILEEGWGRNWGMFTAVAPDTPFDDVLDHFRQFVQVRLPDGRVVFFRFYDPRVQRLFLPSCDAAQAGELFKLPAVWSCESEDGGSLLVHSVRDGTVNCTKIALDSFRDAVTGSAVR
ncbi:MAG TPA: DUF4123 domain-containing protein [Verrucomicrobiales bacterium]|nr:DUF4123 domain-containing protein [Verrucomicrobiales bacterium]